jgi:hypothetical protein
LERFPFAELVDEENLRKLASRTVETYPVEWRVVHEALQNAKDAVRRTGRPGRVEIELDVAEQSVSVTDTGTGFPRERKLLGFGGTDKDDDPDFGINGRQGVGLKAVILATKTFALDAVHEGERWTLKIDDADSYLNGGEPTFEMSDGEPTEASNGSTVRYSFSNGVVSEVLTEILSQQYDYVSDALATTEAEKLQVALETYFRSYTYAGDVNAMLELGSSVPIEINVRVAARGSVTGQLFGRLVDELANGPVETTFPSSHWDVIEAVDRTRRGMIRPNVLTQSLPPAGALGRHNENYLYVGKIADVEGFRSLLDNPNLRRRIDFSQYDRLFEQLRGVYVAIGSRTVLERYVVGPPRQFVAADGIPSAHVLQGPQRGGEATYVANNIHFIANVDAKLNYGKQTIPNPRLVGLVNRFFADAVRATLRNVAISIVGSQIGTSSADDLEDTSRTEADVVARPTLAGGSLFFKREPRDEDALIAIFFELVGRGFLPGYHFYSMSQKATYDGRAAIKLSYQTDVPEPQVDADLGNVEFKVNLNALVDDFETEMKLPAEIQLVVVWDDSLDPAITDYQVVDIEHTDDADRAMGGVAKALHCKRHYRTIQMLVMSDLVRSPEFEAFIADSQAV